MAVDSFTIQGLDGTLKMLKSLPPEIVSKGGGPVRAALRKAADVIRKEVRQNLAVIIATNNVDGENESTGLLDKNIVLTRAKRLPFNGERYTVRIRNKAYPATKGKRVTTAQVARLLEYGTEKRQAYPFIRPAYETKKNEAVQVFVTDVNKRIAAIVRKLERDNGVAG